jgi:putative transposase
MDIQKLRTLYHCIYSENYHLVLITMHRRKCISPEMLVRLKKISTRIISTWEGELLEFNGESDHVHLLLSIPPKVAPSALVNNLKTVTARLIRKEFAGALAKVYDKPVASSLVAVLPSVFLNNILNNKVKISPRYTAHQSYGYGRSTARVIFGRVFAS